MTQIKQIKTDKISENLPNQSNLRSIPKGWSWVKLGDVIDKISTRGIKLKQKEYLQEGKFPVVDQGKELIGGFSNDKDLLVDCELPVIVFGDHTKVKKFIDFKFIAGADGAIIIKPHKVWDAKLFYYFLHCVKFPDKGYARHFQFVEKAVIPLPPLHEQKKIVEKIEELFSSLDSGVASLKKAKEQIRLYRQSALAAAFSGRLTRKDDISSRDVIFSSKAAEPKVEYSNQLPDGWKWVKLGEVGEVVGGGTPSTKIPEFFNGDIYWITPADLTNYKFKFISRGKRNISKEGLKNSSARLIPKGSVLFSSRAPIGYVAISSNELCTNQGFKNLILNDNVYSEYVYYYLKSIKQLAEKHASGTTFKEISAKNFANLPFPLAPKDQQLQIVAEIEKRFSEADNLEKAIDDSLAKAETLRQSILKQAFEGKLV